MLQHEYLEHVKLLKVRMDLPFKDCLQIVDALCNNGFEVVEVRRLDGNAFNMLFIECAETEVEEIVDL